MDLGKQLFVYCERGLDPAFLAEPFNAVSNAAIVLAGIAVWVMVYGQPAGSRRPIDHALAALIVIIGIGSFLFHTYATIWAAIADVAPIGVFMLVYFSVAMRRFFGVSGTGAAVLTVGFALTFWAARQLRCSPDMLISLGGEGGRCLNGSVGYFPALVAMIVIGALLTARRQPQGRAILTAGGIFAVSLTFRTIDPLICGHAEIAGYTLGSHFLWHLLNAVVLFMLMRAAIAKAGSAGSVTGGYFLDRGLHADLRQKN